MIGWLIFALMVLVVLVAMRWPARIGGSAQMLVAAALFTAAAGYAWQGSPRSWGAPAAAGETRPHEDSIFTTERMRMLNHYGETGIVLGTADAFYRWGQGEAAAGLLRNAVASHPSDVDLRIGYAHALQMLAHGAMTPAVQLAFDRADQFSKPDDPRSAYFRGLAELESGDVAAAEQRWRALLALQPADSGWARALRERLLPFDMVRAMAARRDGGGAVASMPAESHPETGR